MRENLERTYGLSNPRETLAGIPDVSVTSGGEADNDLIGRDFRGNCRMAMDNPLRRGA